MDAAKRLFSFEWAHAGHRSRPSSCAIIVKWDDQPGSLQHFAESAVRACKIAMTPPMGPVLLSLDSEMQENPDSQPRRAAAFRR